MNDTKHTDSGELEDNETVFETEANAVDEFDYAPSEPPKAARRGLGFGVVLPLFVLAGLSGAVGGWALTQYVMPKYIAPPQAHTASIHMPEVNLAPLTERIEAVEKKLSAQSSELSFLSAELKSGAASVTVGGVGKTLDITPLMNRLNDLEARLESVSSRPALDAAAPALSAEKTSPPSASIAAPPTINYSAQIDALERRIDVLETDIEQTRALAARPTVIKDTVLLPPFPRAALLAAMTAPRDNGSQGWISRTFKKHISVRNPQEVARAEETLNTIEALAASGDYAAALALIEVMPSDVRSTANDWTRAVKAETETR